MKSIKTALPICGFWDTRQGGRAENQDSCGFIDTPHGFIAIVCDGMGGGPAGKQASVFAVQTIAEYVSKAPVEDQLEDIMANAVEQAHRTIISEGEEHSEMKGMGSTVAAVLFSPKAAIVVHVGDSRVYQFRRGHKVFRTQDHSWVADRVREGSLTEEEAKLTGQTNLITRALGGKGDHLADVTSVAYEKGDRFLLCTDGVWGMLTEKGLEKIAAQTPSLAGAVDSIVLQVDEMGRNSGNRHDNLTLALFETKQDSINKVEMNRKAIFIIRALTVICCISIILLFVLMLKSLKPNPEKELLKQSELRVSQQDKEITRLKDEVDSLHMELAKEKTVAADALKEAAEEKVKAAERAKEEAQRKTIEAQKAAEKAKENHMRADRIDREISAIIVILRDASNKQPGKERDSRINKAVESLKNLSSIDPGNSKAYKKVIDELNKPIAKQKKDAKSHFNLLIKDLEKIKK